MTTLSTRRVGRTSVEVTSLCFGAANLGNLYRPMDDATAAEVVRSAWDAGVRSFDTAPHYGLGLSERRMGRALAAYPRDAYTLSTKVGRLLRPNPAPTGSDLDHLFDVPDDLHRVKDYSADGVRRSLEESLDRLGTDRVDLVLVHDPDADEEADRAVREAMPALVRLRDEGVVRAVGIGMNTWRTPLRFVEETDLDVVMLASTWTLLDRSAEPAVERCIDRGVGILAASPYNTGLLATDRPRAGGRDGYAPVDPARLATAQALAATAERYGVPLPAAALQFPLRTPAVATVVPGLGSVAHVRSSLDRLATDVPEDCWTALETTLEEARP